MQSLDKATSQLMEQQARSHQRSPSHALTSMCAAAQVMMDNVGSTSPVRPAPAAPPQPSPPLFMSALSKLHGGASAAELQVSHTNLLPVVVTICHLLSDARGEAPRVC